MTFRPNPILKRYVAAEDWPAALRLVKSWRNLGVEQEPITRAWEAMTRPEFYRQLGQDPAAHIAAGIAAVQRVNAWGDE